MDSRVGTAFGKYTITALVGRGGMGEVYEAHDNDKRRTVALKILPDQYSKDENFRKRFLRESHAAAMLQEPHVIPIHDWGEIDGSLYIDMRLVRGATLRDLLSEGPLEPSQAVAIIDQIAAALDAAHAEGLIHRDVKPANVLVTSADFAYLVDFGIAETKGDTRLTTAGSQIGSFAYMAPERFNNVMATPAVDVYALACVLYESLTGDAPFRTDSMEYLIAAHITSPPPRPSAANRNVPASFDEVIARGMAKEPDDRYGTAGALGRAAQRALRAVGPSSPHTTASSMDETRAAPHVSSPTVAYPPEPQPVPSPTGPTMGYPPAPQPVPSPTGSTFVTHRERAGERSSRWLLPVFITVAALVLGGMGVVIGLLVKQKSEPVSSPSSTMAAGPLSTTVQSATPTSSGTASSIGSTAPPPLVQGADASGQTCDGGFSLPNATGWATRSGRGSPQTSCYFAHSVLTSYWSQYHNASRDERQVDAPGQVDCTSTHGRCNGSDFVMDCAALGSESWITCTGGDQAKVYLY